jgi:hypothetical protein
VPAIAGKPLYQVTLASGAIATRPTAFPDYCPETALRQIIVSESGEILDMPSAGQG